VGGRIGKIGGPMNKNRILRPTRQDELAPHSEVVVTVAEVNAAVASGSNAFLPGEIPTGKPGRKSAEVVVPNSEPR
jgi:hypothetical protein